MCVCFFHGTCCATPGLPLRCGRTLAVLECELNLFYHLSMYTAQTYSDVGNVSSSVCCMSSAACIFASFRLLHVHSMRQ